MGQDVMGDFVGEGGDEDEMMESLAQSLADDEEDSLPELPLMEVGVVGGLEGHGGGEMEEDEGEEEEEEEEGMPQQSGKRRRTDAGSKAATTGGRSVS